MSFNPGGGGGISTASDVAFSNPSNGQAITYDSALAKWKNATVSGSAADATTSAKGVVQLAGDLGGTAASPTVPGLTAKANDSAVVHDTGNETIAGTKTFSSAPVVPSGSFTTAALSDIGTVLRSVDAVIFYNGSSYPTRSTVTSDALRRVRWVGPTAPTIGGSYAVNNLDVWEQTA